MKHTKSFVVLALCLVCLFSMSMVASAARQNDAGITATKGTPTVDGEIDGIWDEAESQLIGNVDTAVIPSSSATNGILRTMWDENYLYVLIEVDKHGAQIYEAAGTSADENTADCAEVSFSMEGDFGIGNLPSASQEGTGNVKVFTNGAKGGFGPYYNKHIADVKGVMKITAEDKYVVEYALPWAGITPYPGHTLTFEVQINDCVNGRRAGLVSWASTTGCWGWQQTDVHGALYLAPGEGETVKPTEAPTNPPTNPPTDPPTTPPTDAPTDAPTTPSTSAPAEEGSHANTAIIYGIIALVIAAIVAAYFLIKKFKK
ncbi:MAG: hypothetical protein IKI50_01450 [Clostridia bacterium]|nr:hypothetical protein [Clostridia bacterium]